MVRGPLRCLCCGVEMSTTDVIDFRCDCTKGGMGMATMCYDCGKCNTHCHCPGGFTTSIEEIKRRAAAGALSYQREARHADH